MRHVLTYMKCKNICLREENLMVVAEGWGGYMEEGVKKE